MDLGGLHVLITRPQGRGETLAAAIEAAGGHVVSVPLLAIAPLTEDDAAIAAATDARLRELDRYDAAIVISINAVAMGLERAARFWPQWPSRPRWYAIGAATAEAMQHWGIDAIAPAAGMYSEALLGLPELQRMEGRRVLIVRGVGGRETLAETLRARGAEVDYAECYRRVEPVLAASERAALAAPVDAICVNSAETLANLWNNLPDTPTLDNQAPDNQTENARAAVCRRALVVPSRRVAEQARALGFQHVVAAANAGNAATLAALAEIARAH